MRRRLHFGEFWLRLGSPLRNYFITLNRRIKETIRTPLNVGDHRKSFKGYDLRIYTWNVRTLHRPNACKEYITAIQQILWKGHGVRKEGNCNIYYSCLHKMHQFGCGFVVNKRISHLGEGFTPLAINRVRAKLFFISLICEHAPREEIYEEYKDTFYERLEQAYDLCPVQDFKIVLGDFNAKLGRESIFAPTIGKISLSKETFDQGMR